MGTDVTGSLPLHVVFCDSVASAGLIARVKDSGMSRGAGLRLAPKRCASKGEGALLPFFYRIRWQRGLRGGTQPTQKGEISR